MGSIYDKTTPFNPKDYYPKSKPEPSPEPPLPSGMFYNPPMPGIPLKEDAKESKEK